MDYIETDEKLGEGSHSFIKKVIKKSDNKWYAAKIVRNNDPEILMIV